MRGQHLLKRIVGGAMTLIAVFAMMPVLSAHAASEYTVTFRPGNVGNFGIGFSVMNGASVKEMAQEVANVLYGAYDVNVTENGAIKVKVPAGAQIPAAPSYIIPDEGYFVKSWGPEQGETVSRNVDFVVDYGRLTDGVEYTVKYVDEQSGESIAPSATAYANVGDSVTVTAPATITTSDAGIYALTSEATQTLTLEKDAASNVIVFDYTYDYEPETEVIEIVKVIPGDTVVTTETQVTVIDRGIIVDPAPDNGGEDNENQNIADIEDEETPLTDTISSQEETDEEKHAEKESNIPPEIIEIEDEEAPLANLEPERGVNPAVVLAGVLGMMAIVVSVLWMQTRRKKLIMVMQNSEKNI